MKICPTEGCQESDEDRGWNYCPTHGCELVDEEDVCLECKHSLEEEDKAGDYCPYCGEAWS